MDRLTSIDAGFLAQERAGSNMHIGGSTPTSPTSRRSRTRSAVRSTTSSSTSSRARCSAGCIPAAPEQRELVPVAFLAAEQTPAVAIMSYNGGVDIGLIGDYDAMPDLEDLGTLFEEAIDELRDAAFSAEASLRA
jgi:hypothetical protein